MGSNATFGEISPFSCTQMWIEMVHGDSLGHGKYVPLEDLIKLLEFSSKSRFLYRRARESILVYWKVTKGQRLVPLAKLLWV